MASPLRFTLWGLYNFMPELFDAVQLPEGIDKEILIETLMQKSGMLFPAHQQPEMLKLNITNWFKRKQQAFQRMTIALSAEYDPVSNYDRHETWTDTPDVAYTKTGGHTNTVANTTANEQTISTSAYNSDSLTPTDQQKGNGSSGGTDTLTYEDEATTETGTRKHEGHISGNIGVTTSQQMITAELELRRFDIYDYICALFEEDFLYQVY